MTPKTIRVTGNKIIPEYFRLLRVNNINELEYPTQMNPKDKHSTVELSRQYMRVAYTGTGKTDSDAASVRSKYSIPQQLGIFYFEVTIVSKGRDGYVGIGFCSNNVSLQRLPGWEPNSWGYHGDDGNSFNSSGTGKRFGPTFTSNDVIGCGVNFVNKTAFYTKNGVYIGVAFDNLPLDKVEIYPCVGLRTPGEIVEVNFGKKSFSFDICSFVQEQIDDYSNIIQSNTHLDHFHSINLILKHLLFNGYVASASALAKSVGLAITQQELVRCNLKLQIKQLILISNYDQVLEIITREFSSVDDLVIFSVKCQKFLDLVYSSLSQQSGGMEVDEYEVLKHALDYGQQLQDDYRHDDRPLVQQKLIEIFSVLAYPNPLESQVAHFFEPSQKLQLFDYVNSQLFGEDDQLNRFYKQLLVTLNEMEAAGDRSAALMSVVDP